MCRYSECYRKEITRHWGRNKRIAFQPTHLQGHLWKNQRKREKQGRERCRNENIVGLERYVDREEKRDKKWGRKISIMFSAHAQGPERKDKIFWSNKRIAKDSIRGRKKHERKREKEKGEDVSGSAGVINVLVQWVHQSLTGKKSIETSSETRRIHHLRGGGRKGDFSTGFSTLG